MIERLGFAEGRWVKKAEPSSTEIASVLGRTDNWLYLGGHFSKPIDWPGWVHAEEKRLYNDLDNNAGTPPTREVLIRSDNALVRTMNGGQWSEQRLGKGSGFKQTGPGHVLLFGGCAIAAAKADVLAFQALFDKPLIIGWTKATNRKMINLMLGGDGNNEAAGAPWSAVNFWSKLGNGFGDAVKVREAWMATANAIFTAGDPFRSHFAVVDATHVHTLDAAPLPIRDLP
jgi:hypothetical protein